MSDTDVPVEEIARLAGHTSSRTTELIYRHQLRPVMEKGAQAMDQLFGRTALKALRNASSADVRAGGLTGRNGDEFGYGVQSVFSCTRSRDSR